MLQRCEPNVKEAANPMSNSRSPATDSLRVRSIVFTPASPADRELGLIAYVRCIVGNSLQLDGLTVRRTAEGRLMVGFPKRRDAQGRQHSIVNPINAEARAAIEDAILRALGRDLQP